MTSSHLPDVAPSTPWLDTELPIDERVEALLGEMTVEEKLGQLGSAWVGNEEVAEAVAPMQDALSGGSESWESKNGLGHFTRIYGTAPTSTVDGAQRVVDLQRTLVEGSRLRVPAIVHEECLTGFATLGATVYPTALAWAATFDPDLVHRMAKAIGDDMRPLGVHQGLSPVLDVVRDYRWGRVEETLGEDPYLVGMLGTAYVTGLQDAGIIATLKHFAGYSASRAARNHAPVTIGPREFRDVILPPFEMAVRLGGVRSVMNSYSDIDGLPAAANAGLLTGILRDEWGFEGVVVSDYGSIPFLRSMHRVAASAGEAGALALAAGLDVELPDTQGFGEQLLDLVRSGAVPEQLVDRAARRVLRQKAELGLLDQDWSAEVDTKGAGDVDLDSPANRDIARLLAERSVVLLANDGVLPLASAPRIAAVGPCAADPRVLMGCYSFTNHVLPRHPEFGLGIDAPSLLDGLRAEFPDREIDYQPGCPIRDVDRSGFAAAAEAAAAADLCIAFVGDHAGMFGRGTSGEGCDATDLSLPGVQGELVERLLATGTPVVVVVVSGRPYALGDHSAAAALVQAFMPGEEGAAAVAGVLSGRINPSGRLPVQVPRLPGGQPTTYLQPPLGANSEGISNLDPTPLFPFGHGLSYTGFGYGELRLSADEIGTDDEVVALVEVANLGERAGDEVVQLYLHDIQATVTRPLQQLIGFARVALEPGQRAEVAFTVHADRTAFTGIDMRRVVEPGVVELSVGASVTDLRSTGKLALAGDVRPVGPERVLTTPVTITLLPS